MTLTNSLEPNRKCYFTSLKPLKTSTVSEALFIAKTMRGIYLINTNKDNSPFTQLIELRSDWGGTSESLQVERRKHEVLILCVQSRLDKYKPGHKIIEYAIPFTEM